MLLTQVGEDSFISKAKFVNVVKNEEIPVQFNPQEYSVSEGASYTTNRNKLNQKEIKQYSGNDNKSLNLTLYFDSAAINGFNDKREQKDVYEKTSKIANLAKPLGSEHKPPLVQFIWGTFSFKGMITKASTTFTLFDTSGKPIRAKMDIILEEYRDETANRTDPTQSPDRTKSRMITQDSDIWTLAWKEYGDIGMWRTIAKENNIMNPLFIKPGTMLRVPAIIEK